MVFGMVMTTGERSVQFRSTCAAVFPVSAQTLLHDLDEPLVAAHLALERALFQRAVGQHHDAALLAVRDDRVGELVVEQAVLDLVLDDPVCAEGCFRSLHLAHGEVADADMRTLPTSTRSAIAPIVSSMGMSAEGAWSW